MRNTTISENKKQWIYPRHKTVRAVLAGPLALVVWLLYGFRVTVFQEEKNRQYLILANHQTGFDQFYPSLAFRNPVYYVASEDIFSMGWLSRLIQWLVAPIPIKKQVTDIRAVITCMKVAREGGNIAIFPEGNRTFSGETGAMNPAIGGLARKLGLPIAFFRIEGGYGVQPRWSDVRRKGKMKAYVSSVLEPEEYKDWSNEKLYRHICRELYQNEADDGKTYAHKQNAQYIERALYVCPNCGITHFKSSGDTLRCTTCGRQAKYLQSKRFSGDFPFASMLEWYRFQEDYVNRLDPLAPATQPLIRDTCSLYRVALYSKKQRIARHVELSLYTDRMEMTGVFTKTFPFGELDTITILGKNKLNLYYGDTVYQIQSHKRFNGLKYLNLYHRYKNVTGEGKNGRFLGL